MTTMRFGDFGITVGFHVDHSIVAVRGDVDALTAPTLGAMLGVLVDQTHADLVLDLCALTFIDAAGLGVIADVSARLATSNRGLTLRAAPAPVYRVLGMTGVDALVRVEASPPTQAALGPEQRSDDHSGAVVIEPADLSADLARVGVKPNDAVIDVALRLVTVLAGSTVTGADGVSVTLQRGGRLATVASSNDTVGAWMTTNTQPVRGRVWRRRRRVAGSTSSRWQTSSGGRTSSRVPSRRASPASCRPRS